MVSKERAGAGNRNFQCRNERGRDYYSAHRAVDCGALGLAQRVCGNRRDRVSVAGALAADLWQSGKAQARFEGGTGVHPQRPAGACGENEMVAVDPTTPDLGVRHGQAADGSDLVVLSVLGAGIPARQTRTSTNGNWNPADGDL